MYILYNSSIIVGSVDEMFMGVVPNAHACLCLTATVRERGTLF